MELEGETLRVVLHLKDGWDNAPHHTQLKNFPHHKHIGRQKNMQPTAETRLEEVMRVIQRKI